MDSSQVKRKMAVDEHPHVVVALETEHEPLTVGEVGVEFHGEAVIVARPRGLGPNPCPSSIKKFWL